MPDFLQLSELLLAPPVAAAVSLFIILGFWWLGERLADRLFGKAPDILQRSACYLSVLAITSLLIQLLGYMHFHMLDSLKFTGLLLCLLGLLQVRNFMVREPILLAASRFLGSNQWERLRLLILLSIPASLFLATLGPATDADSLDYHLGTALDWLGAGGIYARPDWLHASLTGQGEYLIMLGLATGTDSLSAVIQFSGLLIAWRVMLSLSSSRKQHLLSTLLIFSCPLLLFVIPNQKPQMLPAVAIVVSSMLIITYRHQLNIRLITLSLACVAFGMSHKYSFYLSGVLVIGLIWWLALLARRLPATILITAIIVLTLIGSIWIRNLIFYGNPVAPFFESALGSNNDAATMLANYLKSVNLPETTPTLSNFITMLFVPTSLGGFSTVLGIGFLAIFTLSRKTDETPYYLFLFITSFILIAIFSQFSARYFIEPFLWGIAATLTTPWNYRKRILAVLLSLQAIPVLAASLFGAWLLLPGSFSSSNRHLIMQQLAFNYSEAKWIDKTAPQDSFLIADWRANGLSPRPFVASESVYRFSSEQAEQRIQQLKQQHEYAVLLISSYSSMPELNSTTSCQHETRKYRRSFNLATRNPFNRDSSYEKTIIIIPTNCLDKMK